MLTLLPSLPGKQFFTRLDVNSQEELDAFRKTPNHPTIITSTRFLHGDPRMPKGSAVNDHLVITDDMPLTFSREQGNQVVFGYQKTPRHKMRWQGVSLCLDEKQNEELMAKHRQKGIAAMHARLAADPLRGCISVATLKKLLDENVPLADQHRVMVALSCDSEGNSYSPIGSIDASYKDKESYVAAPVQTFKADDGRTSVIYVEFVPRSPDDVLDGHGNRVPKTPTQSRRDAVILFPVN